MEGVGPSAAPSRRGAEVLPIVATLLGRDRGVRVCALLGRELLALGHDVHLMPPAYVKPRWSAERQTPLTLSDLRISDPADDEGRGGEERRPAGGADAPQGP